MTPTGTLVLALFATLSVLSCADSDVSNADNGGSAGADVGGSGGEAQIPFCAALTVIRNKCQRCHQSPLQNGAPVPFLTYEDTQAQYYTTTQKWSDAMVGAVTRGFMPDVLQNDPPRSLMPPVEPLTADEKSTLLAWLAQGAKPEGGTACP